MYEFQVTSYDFCESYSLSLGSFKLMLKEDNNLHLSVCMYISMT